MHLRISKLFLAFVLASLALLLMSSLVMAAPSKANVVNTGPSPFQSPPVKPTVPFTHPVALAISTFFSSSFDISYTQVMSMHESGLGFGVIARIYLTARAVYTTPEAVLALFQLGKGWGQIAKELGVHPGGNGLGTIMRGHKGNKGNQGNTGDPSPCQGNNCNAPGQQNNPNKPGNSDKPDNSNKPNKPDKPAKPEAPKGPKH